MLFSSALLLLGVGLIAFASGRLNTAIPVASALGFFGGAAYSTAYSLIQEHTDDELRGRTFTAAYTIIRTGTLIGLGIFPLLAGAFGSVTSRGIAGTLPGSRVTLWIAGLFVIGGGLLSMRAIKARRCEEPEQWGGQGLLPRFRGWRRCRKSTQIAAFAQMAQGAGRTGGHHA